MVARCRKEYILRANWSKTFSFCAFSLYIVQDKEVKELEQILSALEKYHPTIPDSVTEYYLRKTGFHTTDPRV